VQTVDRGLESQLLVEIENVRYRYGRAPVWALDGISVRIERGRVVGLVGPNGSGKTTLYRLMLGFMPPQQGRVRVAGMAPTAYRKTRGIAYLPEQVRLPGRVRVRELAVFMGRLAGLQGTALSGSIDGLIGTLALEDKADALIGTLSHGYRQRVGLLAALLGDPELLLFDEPASGLDPASVAVLRSLLRALKRRARTVVVSSHNLLELERVCDDVYVLRHGRLLGRWSQEEIEGRPDVWVVQLTPGSVALGRRSEAVCTALGGVRMAVDEVAFADEQAACSYAESVRVAGDAAVEAIERRRFDLEYLFHSLVQEEHGKGEAG